MSKLLEMFQQDFMQNVLAGTIIVAALCSYLGVFIVLRRAVFVGAALAQVSSLGVALALFLGGFVGVAGHAHLPAGPFALALTVVAAGLMAVQYRECRLPRETGVGVMYAAAGAIAILLVAVSSHGESEVLNLLFGNVLTITFLEVVGLATLTFMVALVHGLFYKEFLFVSFDPDMATALGVRARFWNVVLFVTIGVTISLAIRAAGALVVFNFLVMPAATALMLGRGLKATFAVAAAVGMISALAGIGISYVQDWPTGPTIVAVNTLLLALAAATRFNPFRAR
jgi:ABC-type Mn2+/Zn2+ transport system permease subunit